MNKAEQKLKKIADTLTSGQDDFRFCSESALDLLDIAKEKSAPASKTFDVAKKLLASDQNDAYTLGFTYEALGEIVMDKPILHVFDTFKKSLKSDNNGSSSLSDAYRVLAKIATGKPILRRQVLETFDQALMSSKNNEYSLNDAYIALGDIVKIKPTSEYNSSKEIVEAKSVSQVFATFKHALKSDKNSWFSLDKAYDVLDKIARTNPELRSDVVETVNVALKSDKNNDITRRSGQEILDYIAKQQTKSSTGNRKTVVQSYLKGKEL